MANLFSPGEKLFAKRDKINVFAMPNGGGTLYKWLYRPMRSPAGQGLREYKQYDELGPFATEFEQDGVTYYEVTSWDNAEPVLGNPYTVVRSVYVRADADAVLTQSQLDDAQRQAKNVAAIDKLKATVYPAWTTQKIELPIDAYWEANQDGNDMLFLKWANGYVAEYEKFKDLTIENKRAVANTVKPPAADSGNDDDTGSGDSGGSKSFSLYAIIAGLGMMVLFTVYMFLFKPKKQ